MATKERMAVRRTSLFFRALALHPPFNRKLKSSGTITTGVTVEVKLLCCVSEVSQCFEGTQRHILSQCFGLDVLA